jgi:hypothetical protein
MYRPTLALSHDSSKPLGRVPHYVVIAVSDGGNPHAIGNVLATSHIILALAVVSATIDLHAKFAGWAVEVQDVA